MNCEVCKNEVRVSSGDEGTNSYEPVNRKLASIAEEYGIPFKCPLCGCLHFRVIKPTRDVVMLWRINRKIEKTAGGIFLPDDDYIGGNTQEKFGRYTAVILAFGNKVYNAKKKMIGVNDEIHVGDIVFYDKGIPEGWRYDFQFGNEDYYVTYCGAGDLLAIEESINETVS